MANVYASAAVNFATEPLDDAAQARAAARMALKFDPRSADALAAEGFLDALVGLRWKDGEQEIRRAIAIAPQDATLHNRLGVVLDSQGRFAEAIQELRFCENLDPLAAGAGVTLGFASFLARQYDAALRQLSKVERLHPDLYMVHPYIGDAWIGKRDFPKAMAEYQSVRARVPTVAYRIAYLMAITGKQKEARAILARLEHPQPGAPPPDAFSLGAIYGALGDRDRAFAWLDRAYDRRNVALLKVHPFLDPLRHDPRFAALLRKSGF